MCRPMIRRFAPLRISEWYSRPMNTTQPSTTPMFIAALNRKGARSPPPHAITNGRDENNVTATSM